MALPAFPLAHHASFSRDLSSSWKTSRAWTLFRQGKGGCLTLYIMYNAESGRSRRGEASQVSSSSTHPGSLKISDSGVHSRQAGSGQIGLIIRRSDDMTQMYQFQADKRAAVVTIKAYLARKTGAPVEAQVSATYPNAANPRTIKWLDEDQGD